VSNRKILTDAAPDLGACRMRRRFLPLRQEEDESQKEIGGSVKSSIRRRKTLKPVVQLEATGCGIASVAALAGVTYRTAQRSARRLGIVATDDRLWSGTAYVRRLLQRYGLRVHRSQTPFSSWSALPSLALLAVRWHRERGRPFWHWVVFVREEGGAHVLDSAAALTRHVRTDFWRMRPKWFIAITAACREPRAGLARRRHG
jgi:ABC-type bacteriocin/lantibiotic exporter with double-glycine peptidase domain